MINFFSFVFLTKIYPTLITIKIYHGGVFTSFPGRRYINGKHDFIDLVNTDELFVHDLDAMMKELGYNEKEQMFYHFLIPNSELDFGLQDLRSDQDMLNLLNYAPKIKFIDVFIEHGKTNLCTYLTSPNRGENLLLEWVDTKVEGTNDYDNFDPFDGLETYFPKVDKGKGVDDSDDDTEDRNYLID